MKLNDERWVPVLFAVFAAVLIAAAIAVVRWPVPAAGSISPTPSPDLATRAVPTIPPSATPAPVVVTLISDTATPTRARSTVTPTREPSVTPLPPSTMPKTGEDLSMDFTKILDMGGLAALAVIALWMLNETWKARLEDSKRYAADLRRLLDQVQHALENNTRAMTQWLERCDEVDEEEEEEPEP